MVFSSHQRLKRHTGKLGTSRAAHLQRLVQEFHNTKSRACKEQVMANLANFAYDPINYPWFHDLKLVDLFLSQLLPSVKNPKLSDFALGGLSNLCLDPYSHERILAQNGVELIISRLEDDRKTAVVPALTLLYYLFDDKTRTLISSFPASQRVLELSKSVNPDTKNAAQLVLEKLHFGRGSPEGTITIYAGVVDAVTVGSHATAHQAGRTASWCTVLRTTYPLVGYKAAAAWSAGEFVRRVIDLFGTKWSMEVTGSTRSLNDTQPDLSSCWTLARCSRFTADRRSQKRNKDWKCALILKRRPKRNIVRWRELAVTRRRLMDGRS